MGSWSPAPSSILRRDFSPLPASSCLRAKVPFRETTGEDATAIEGSLGTSPRLRGCRSARERPGIFRDRKCPASPWLQARTLRTLSTRSVPIATPLSPEPEPELLARQANRAESLASSRHLCGALNEVRGSQDADAARGSRALPLREPRRLVPGRGFSALGQVGGPTLALLRPACTFRVGASVVGEAAARKKSRDARLGLRMWRQGLRSCGERKKEAICI